MTDDDAPDAPNDPVIPVASCAPSEDDADAADAGRMSLGEHLEELRRRLIVCLIVLGLTFFAGMVLYGPLWAFALRPLTITADMLGVEPEKVATVVLLSDLHGFLLSAKLAFFASFILCFPLLSYETWAFVAPGLTKRERRAAGLIFTAGGALFLCGAALAFFYAAPLGLRFLIPYNASLPHTTTFRTMDYYLGFVGLCCLGFGLAFETPLVMMALAWVRLIRPDQMLRYWRHVVLVLFVAGAVLTPPDPFTQIFLAGTLAALFFLGYLLARWVTPSERAGPDDSP